jgi:hypothetical protein
LLTSKGVPEAIISFSFIEDLNILSVLSELLNKVLTKSSLLLA